MAKPDSYGAGASYQEELETIVDCTYGDPCIDPIFGPTASATNGYRSSVTVGIQPLAVWKLDFDDGAEGTDSKTNENYVRAVRSLP